MMCNVSKLKLYAIFIDKNSSFVLANNQTLL